MIYATFVDDLRFSNGTSFGTSRRTVCDERQLCIPDHVQITEELPAVFVQCNYSCFLHVEFDCVVSWTFRKRSMYGCCVTFPFVHYLPALAIDLLFLLCAWQFVFFVIWSIILIIVSCSKPCLSCSIIIC